LAARLFSGRIHSTACFQCVGSARGAVESVTGATGLRAPPAETPPAKQTSNESTKAAIGRASGCAALTVRANSALKSSSASVTCNARGRRVR
jgi:hypothetical protein